MTDVNVEDDDDRVDRAFKYATQKLLTKEEMNTVHSSAKQQVRLSFVAFFL